MNVIGKKTARAIMLGCATVALACLGAARADNYPSRPVTIVVPFTPGGSTDILARYEAEVLQRQMHGTFIVDNKPGAGGEIGIAYAARAVPDGYTLLHAPSVITLLPFLKKHVSYDLAKDFDPITVVGLTQFGLVVNPALHIDTVSALIARAKADPNALTYASAGVGTPHQIFAELFKTMTGVNIRHIPYKGSNPGLTDVASGAVSMEFTDLAPAAPLIQAGKLKLIALLGAKRDPDTPNVPTWARPCPATWPSPGRASSPAPARRSRSSTTSPAISPPISSGPKRWRSSRPSASLRSPRRRRNSAPSSPRKATSGGK